MERETGLEPATPSLEGLCSSQLSYSRLKLFCVCLRGLRFVVGRCAGGEGRIRTSEGVSQRVYSPSQLTALVPLRGRSSALLHPSLPNGPASKKIPPRRVPQNFPAAQERTCLFSV